MNTDVIEGNNIIAIFDGYTFEPESTLNGHKGVYRKEGKASMQPNINHGFHPKYHSSWSWIMPICKKFDTLFEGDNYRKLKRAKRRSEKYQEHCDNIDNAVTTYEVEQVWEKLVAAITWYNNTIKE